MSRPGDVIPFSFDLSLLVQRSVASLYSHLVTRPTGRALRLGIESQIGELGEACVSVLDFTQVVVLDYSCADEAVAKLLQRFLGADRPVDAYFVARGLGEQHREPIEVVLERHHLALVAERADGYDLLGFAAPLERAAWTVVEHARHTTAPSVARCLDIDAALADATLGALASRRVLLSVPGQPGAVRALSTLLNVA
jgi:hypothetical protein